MLADIESAYPWQHRIKQDQIGSKRIQDVERRFAVKRRTYIDSIQAEFENRLQKIDALDGVIYD
jgi:uncharacterized protein YnzC (UPF0291/DUF896 family)